MTLTSGARPSRSTSSVPEFCDRKLCPGSVATMGQDKAMRSWIRYIESKGDSLQGPARIGRVTFTKSGKGIYYQGREFYRINRFKANYAEVGTGEPFWISGPRRDGQDRLYGPSALLVEIDDDVREEYWRRIRNKPEWSSRRTTWFDSGHHFPGNRVFSSANAWRFARARPTLLALIRPLRD